MTALKVLATMCSHARVKPYTAHELASIHGLSVATVYYTLKALTKAGFITHVHNGYVLSQLVLNAGTMYQAQLARITIQTITEELYAAKDSKTTKH